MKKLEEEESKRESENENESENEIDWANASASEESSVSVEDCENDSDENNDSETANGSDDKNNEAAAVEWPDEFGRDSSESRTDRTAEEFENNRQHQNRDHKRSDKQSRKHRICWCDRSAAFDWIESRTESADNEDERSDECEEAANRVDSPTELTAETRVRDSNERRAPP